MKTNKIYSKFLLAGSLLMGGMALTSCEDFLTVLPTNQITEDDFWNDKNDLDNVRAGAYRQLTISDVTKRILYWGELRSDNFAQNDMTQTDITYLQTAILQPTQGMFKWGHFYTGINYCNKVLERGEKMTQEGHEVDPSFRKGDWLPIKAEMQAVRALNYFYLVKAFRNVPFVTKSVSTDAEAKASRIAATPGVVILDSLCNQLEVAKTYARDKFSNSSETKGRFTKRAIYALLADMYVWRGSMLSKALAKGDTLYKEDGTAYSEGQLNSMAADCFQKAIDNCDYVMECMQKDYEENLTLMGGKEDEDINRIAAYPYLNYINSRASMNVYDDVYSTIWAYKNSDESVLELQYDGDQNINSAISDYLAKYESGNLSNGAMIGASALSSSAMATVNPDRGFGKTDIRLLETYDFKTTTATQVYHKNIATTFSIKDIKDVSQGFSSKPDYRAKATMNANWPIYRLADVMLLKAEAIARMFLVKSNDVAAATQEGSDGALVNEGFKLVNAIFKRSNPALRADNSNGSEYKCDRLKDDYATAGTAKKASDLLTLVYNERQREFVGEGKRWFDLVRQAEFTNDAQTTLTTYITLPTATRNRLKQLWSLYNPINTDEMKINGVEYGGKLVQNPVWDRYTTK